MDVVFLLSQDALGVMTDRRCVSNANLISISFYTYFLSTPKKKKKNNDFEIISYSNDTNSNFEMLTLNVKLILKCYFL